MRCKGDVSALGRYLLRALKVTLLRSMGINSALKTGRGCDLWVLIPRSKGDVAAFVRINSML